ncbi:MULTISPECIES: NUDIX hydrolase [unclassified Streptomyces]|uniref:NUDIX hydrolase n=1 Tax=unclassified Streptomyces TaxID=2593676 RepID=UPI002250B279|nr:MULTISPECIES: NUDIX hydrolase [unclassified Streptomyces]MCX4880830.1 NUDIX hydrolase [Streptomyces sp. NBC_00847]MCX5420835.1 NUDIX hydrolase [Streptomyces sp. NBC_00078]
MRRKLRVAAYAMCVRDGQLLLARWIDGDGVPEWTLPGGGMEHGEDPYDTVRREVDEETGYDIEVTGLLGVDTNRRRFPRRFGRTVDHQGLRLIYEARITGGELRPEVGGSTDMAAWHPLEEVAGLNRVGLVDAGLALWRERPASGHVTPAARE